MKVFVSHAFGDEARFDDLCHALENAQIPYWHPKKMRGGASLRDQLRKAIDTCDLCIFLATRNSVESDWCTAELGAFWGSPKKVIVYVADESFTDADLPEQFKGDIWYRKIRDVVEEVKQTLKEAADERKTQEQEEGKSPLISNDDVEDLSGIWYAAHLSRNEKGDIAISRHEYELKFSEFGKVTGKMEDKLSKANLIFQVEGAYTNEGVLALILHTDKLGLLGAQLHYMLEPKEKNIGVITSYDRQNVPFTTLVVFSRNPVGEADLKNEFNNWRQSFVVIPQAGK